MWWKKKQEDPVKMYQLQFRITYRLSNGKGRSTLPISINIPATSKEQAVKKLRGFVSKRIEVTIM